MPNAHHSHRDLGKQPQQQSRLINQRLFKTTAVKTTFHRREKEGEKKPLPLLPAAAQRLIKWPNRERRLEAEVLLVSPAACAAACTSVTSAVRALVPAVGAVGDAVAQFAHGDADLRVQAAMLVDGTLVHLAVRAWRTERDKRQKTTVPRCRGGYKTGKTGV